MLLNKSEVLYKYVIVIDILRLLSVVGGGFPPLLIAFEDLPEAREERIAAR